MHREVRPAPAPVIVEGVDLVALLRKELARQRERVDVIEQALRAALAAERDRHTVRSRCT